MSRKLALKRLSHSDLTLFKAYFDQNPGTKQKAINLNSDVLVDYFYPRLPAEVPVQLIINGPGITTRADTLTRKIVRSAASKNRRLNGELVHNPTGSQSDRYTRLQPGDLALLEFFDGPTGYPERVSMVLVSATEPEDAMAFTSLSTYFGASPKTMLVIGEARLAGLLDGKISPGHPLQAFLTDEAELELLAEGGDVELDEPELEAPALPSVPALRRPRVYKPKDFNKSARPSLRRVTPEAMAKSKAAATENGEAGEELVNQYLCGTLESGECEWTSRRNAASPYDFMLRPATEQTMIDVKTTISGFDAPFHISINELKQAASAPDEYLIYRVYDVKGTPKLRISGNIRDFAAGLLMHVAALPPGVIADGFTLKPSMLVAEFNFGAEIDLSPDEDDF
jgi:hypothetical protein